MVQKNIYPYSNYFKKKIINHSDVKNSFNKIKENKLSSDIKALKTKKRRIEISLAVFLLFVVVFVTYGQLTFFGSDPWIFFTLININAILMLVVLFLVARNVMGLLLERRRQIFGSRLKTRLVLAFFSISFVPILIMFLSANKILTTSVNYWFTSQVENSMEAALDVGQSFFEAASARLKSNLMNFGEELVSKPEKNWEEQIRNYKFKNNLSVLGILDNKTSNLSGTKIFNEKIWLSNNDFTNIWQNVRHSINLHNLEKTDFEFLYWTDQKGDYVITVLKMPKPYQSLYILGAESIGKGLITQLDKISAGFKEYTELKNLKQPLKLSFSLILGILSLIMLFASIWLAFRISKELTNPILALAKGTKQIASGDWDFKVDDKGQDELGQLVNSFNIMTAELKQSQDRLQKMNWLIEDKNLILIERNQYIEAILEYVTTGIVTLDEHGTLITINKAACDIFKVRAEQYEGLSLYGLLSEEKSNLIKEMYEFIQNNIQKTWVKEVEFLLQDQYFKILIQAVALPTFTKEFNRLNFHQSNTYLTGSIILVLEDITELSKEQRLMAWKEVAKRIAHEIKNPLTPIKLSTERIQRKFSNQINDPVFMQCTDLIIKEVSRMQDMVADFSTLASLPAIRLETTNLKPILQELLSLFKTSHPNIEWNYQEKNQIPILQLDKIAFHRAIFNILKNATEAINAKIQKISKQYSTDIDNQNNYRGIVNILCYDNPKNSLFLDHQQAVIIEISDNGAGISHEEALSLFEPYFSKKSSGMGLGLTIVRSIINEHGGSISAFNQNKFTLIKIVLPYKSSLPL